MFHDGCTSSTAVFKGCGSMLHPDFLTDRMKRGSEQACVNSDACITERLRAVLQTDLEEAGCSVEDLQCQISWNAKYIKIWTPKR